MKSRLFRICAVLLMLAVIFPATVLAARRMPHIGLTAGRASVAAGESFTVTVTCRAIEAATFTGGFTFDTTILEVTDITPGDAPVLSGAVSGSSTVQEANAAGKVALYAIHDAAASYGTGTLLTVSFRSKCSGTAVLEAFEDSDGVEPFRAFAEHIEIAVGVSDRTVYLTFTLVSQNTTLRLLQGDDEVWSCDTAAPGVYALPVVPGCYTLCVSAPDVPVRIYAIDTAQSAELGEVVALCCGDVNGSGVRDAADMQALYEYLSTGIQPGALAGTDYFDLAADCNGDGSINILDYQRLYDALLTGESLPISVRMASPTTLSTQSDISE